MPSLVRDFEQLQRVAWAQHSASLCGASMAALGGVAGVRAAPMAADVGSSFVRLFNDCRHHRYSVAPAHTYRRSRRKRSAAAAALTFTAVAQMELVFHGTPRRNHGSIFQHGLLRAGQTRPGMVSAVGVAHGSSFGRGIYVGDAAVTSLGYCCGERSVLVCGLLGSVILYLKLVEKPGTDAETTAQQP